MKSAKTRGAAKKIAAKKATIKASLIMVEGPGSRVAIPDCFTWVTKKFGYQRVSVTGSKPRGYWGVEQKVTVTKKSVV